MGFSWLGTLFLVALLIPNIIWARRGMMGSPVVERQGFLSVLERTGQAAVSILLVLGNIRFSGWNAWFIVSLSLMALYELWWIRFFRGEPTEKRLSHRFLGIPLPGAVLPVLAFITLAVATRNIPLGSAACVFAVGHIGEHLTHPKERPNGDTVA